MSAVLQLNAYPAGKDSTQSRAVLSGKVTSLVAPGAPIAISAYSITSNVITFTTATQALVANQVVTISGFPTSTFLNGAVLTVSATGLTTTQFEAAFTHANASATEAGIATLYSPIYPALGIPVGNTSGQWSLVSNGGGTEIMPSQNPVPLLGSAFFYSLVGKGLYQYVYDYVNFTLRIYSGGTELSTSAAIVPDTIGFTAEFARAL